MALRDIMRKLAKGATEQISYSHKLPPMPSVILIAAQKRKGEVRRWFFISLGFVLFFTFYFLPPLPNAIDPSGTEFELSQSAKAGIGLFLLAAVWWVFEVVPIGITSIMIGVMQTLFFIRPDQNY